MLPPTVAIATALTFALHGAAGCQRESPHMSTDIEASKRAFTSQPQNRVAAAEALLPLLEPGLTTDEVIDLLGRPGLIVWQYTLFYSSYLLVRFSGDSQLVGVQSDLMTNQKPIPATGRAADDAEAQSASADFKAQPYSRQEPAKILIPFLAIGMRTQEVDDLLGPPNASSWRYPLTSGERPFLALSFDGNTLSAATIEK